MQSFQAQLLQIQLEIKQNINQKAHRDRNDPPYRSNQSLSLLKKQAHNLDHLIRRT